MGSGNSIALIINTFNDAQFLTAAIDSALAQEKPFEEIVVVDDGSRESPQAIVARYPGVRLIHQRNAGLAAARNAGLALVNAEYVVFLDADDLLRPNATADGVAAHAVNPGAALVYGAYVRVDANGTTISSRCFAAIGDDPYETLLRSNAIAMHATVVYDRAALLAAGGFDPSLRLCEDYDLYLRIALTHRISCHPAVVAAYRRHDKNISLNYRAMLRTALAVHNRHRQSAADRREWALAFDEGRANLRNDSAVQSLRAARDRWSKRANPFRFAWDVAEAVSISPLWMAKKTQQRVFELIRGYGRPYH